MLIVDCIYRYCTYIETILIYCPIKTHHTIMCLFTHHGGLPILTYISVHRLEAWKISLTIFFSSNQICAFNSRRIEMFSSEYINNYWISLIAHGPHRCIYVHFHSNSRLNVQGTILHLLVANIQYMNSVYKHECIIDLFLRSF